METVVSGCSEAVTRAIRISVNSTYLQGRSAPMARTYVFAYEVTIRNEGTESVRLMTRHWVIRDAHGVEDEVEGVGVIGETPVIRPGSCHTYSSYCPLKTVFGTMRGSYGMVTRSGENFRATVAPFTLVIPTAVN